MTRRDLIRKLLGTAAAGGAAMTATVAATTPDNPAFLIVLEAPGHISPEVADHLKAAVDVALHGTAFANVKVFVLGDGLTLKTIGTDGRLLTRSATPRKRKRRGRA
jgi:hypothetical protein